MTKEWTAEEIWESVGLRGRLVFGRVLGRIQKQLQRMQDHLLWIFVRLQVDCISTNRVMNLNVFKGLHHIELNIAGICIGLMFTLWKTCISLKSSHSSSPAECDSTFSLYCIVPYMAFCEWVLLGNWSALKRSNLVLVFKMMYFLSAGSAELSRRSV